jgi:membrane protease subunit (stomatin/prohibitin family)
MSDLREVMICYNDLDAEIVKGNLEKDGIDVYISRDDCGGMEPQLQMTEGIKVMVPSGQMNSAIALLQGMEERASIEKANPKTQWQCENCGEILESQFTDCWNCGVARRKKIE